MFHTMNFNPTQVAMSSILVLSLAIPTTIATPTPARADLADALVVERKIQKNVKALAAVVVVAMP